MSRVNNIEYDKFQVLNSTMTFKNVVSKGFGSNFSWEEEIFQKGYYVATAKSLDLDPEYNYSKKKIKEMIQNKQIILYVEYDKCLGDSPILQFRPTKEEDFDILKINVNNDRLQLTELQDANNFFNNYGDYLDIKSLKEGETDFSKEVYNQAISLLRENISKKEIIKDYQKIILFLNKNLNDINSLVTMLEGEMNSYLQAPVEINKLYKKSQKTLPKIKYIYT